MSKKITIAIDAMGGDNSPDKTIQGVSLFLKKYKWNKAFRKFSWKSTSCGPLCKIHES